MKAEAAGKKIENQADEGSAALTPLYQEDAASPAVPPMAPLEFFRSRKLGEKPGDDSSSPASGKYFI